MSNASEPIFTSAKEVANYLRKENPDRIVCALSRKDGNISIIFVNYDEMFALTTIKGMLEMVKKYNSEFEDTP